LSQDSYASSECECCCPTKPRYILPAQLHTISTTLPTVNPTAHQTFVRVENVNVLVCVCVLFVCFVFVFLVVRKFDLLVLLFWLLFYYGVFVLFVVRNGTRPASAPSLRPTPTVTVHYPAPTNLTPHRTPPRFSPPHPPHRISTRPCSHKRPSLAVKSKMRMLTTQTSACNDARLMNSSVCGDVCVLRCVVLCCVVLSCVVLCCVVLCCVVLCVCLCVCRCLYCIVLSCVVLCCVVLCCVVLCCVSLHGCDGQKARIETCGSSITSRGTLVQWNFDTSWRLCCCSNWFD
jgi:hypothetical protein